MDKGKWNLSLSGAKRSASGIRLCTTGKGGLSPDSRDVISVFKQLFSFVYLFQSKLQALNNPLIPAADWTSLVTCHLPA